MPNRPRDARGRFVKTEPTEPDDGFVATIVAAVSSAYAAVFALLP